MLANPYYIGIVRYAGVEYDGNHEPLIEKATFERACAVRDAHGHAEERDRKHEHYLKGTLYCGRCGSRMSLTPATERSDNDGEAAATPRARTSTARDGRLPAMQRRRRRRAPTPHGRQGRRLNADVLGAQRALFGPRASQF